MVRECYLLLSDFSRGRRPTVERGFKNMKALLVLASVCVLQAQNPMSKETKDLYSTVKGYILKSAEKMPESNYSFKPSPDVRNYGAILGHLVDDQYFFCSAAKGEKKDSKAESEITTKAGLIEALNAAFAYCDSAYDQLTDAKSPMHDEIRARRTHHERAFSTSTSRTILNITET